MIILQFCWCLFFGSWVYIMVTTKWSRNGNWVLKSLVAASFSLAITLFAYFFLSVLVWLGN